MCLLVGNCVLWAYHLNEATGNHLVHNSWDINRGSLTQQEKCEIKETKTKTSYLDILMEIVLTTYKKKTKYKSIKAAKSSTTVQKQAIWKEDI